MTNSNWNRGLTFFSLGIGTGLPALMHLLMAQGWLPNRDGLKTLAIAVGALCILGAYLAYRVSAEQVKADRKDIGLDG